MTVCHSRSRDLPALTRQADIVVVAIGQAAVPQGRHGPARGGGRRRRHEPRCPTASWCGDVDFDAVSEVAGAITPVPGGVGPMTITMLLHNTLTAAG